MVRKKEEEMEITRENLVRFFEERLVELEFKGREASCLVRNISFSLDGDFEFLKLNSTPEKKEIALELLEKEGISRKEAREALRYVKFLTPDAQKEFLFEVMKCALNILNINKLGQEILNIKHDYLLLNRAIRIAKIIRENQKKLPENTSDFSELFDEKSKFYAPKLAMLFHAWRAVKNERSTRKTIKQNLVKWLQENAADFGLAKLTKESLEDLASVANWEPLGGRKSKKAKKIAPKSEKEAKEEDIPE